MQRRQLWIRGKPVVVSPAISDGLLQRIESYIRFATSRVGGAKAEPQFSEERFPNPCLRTPSNFGEELHGFRQ